MLIFRLKHKREIYLFISQKNDNNVCLHYMGTRLDGPYL